jgi:putative hemolysin
MATAPLTTANDPGLVTPGYRLRLAATREDLRAAQRLRFQVFNEELGEGLIEAWVSGHDEDCFDEVCDHLLVEDQRGGGVVGTYRLLPGPRALSAGTGYYSAQEFDLTPFEPHRPAVLELGRACVAAAHRNQSVLSLLWRGIARYARERGARFLLGCSSLPGADPAAGAAAWAQLAPRCLAAPEFLTLPTPSCTFDLPAPDRPPAIPRLMLAYLAIGAKICAPPALDREFNTIDFLTLLDLATVPPAVARKYLH